jgi:threonylcarbamoyladenosine tRNA methylthiotransferase MtaB
MNNPDIFRQDCNQPTVAFSTVGCRLNQSETDAVKEQFSERGWKVVDFNDKADLYYINTCTVTGRADRSSRKLIHRARRQNEEALVVAAGCYAGSAAETLRDEGKVDLVLGVYEKNQPFDFIPDAMHRPDTPLVFVGEDKNRKTLPAVGTRVSGRSRAFLKIQDGCDHSCAYCAVTLVRGTSRSVLFEEINLALDRIISVGYEEVVLTGVDITAWGKDLPELKRDFVDIVQLAANKGIPRVRISSLEPWELSPKRINRLSSINAWCEHLHVSLQSADVGVLNKMSRPTDLGKLKESFSELIRLRPNATIGADIIVGFPGESENAFNRSLAFLDEGPLHYLHVFPFSARPGTPAFGFPDQIDLDTIKRRAETLRSEARNRRRIHLANSIGRTEDVLFEKDGSIGYSKPFLRVKLDDGKQAKPKKISRVKITRIDDHKDLLYAEADS